MANFIPGALQRAAGAMPAPQMLPNAPGQMAAPVPDPKAARMAALARALKSGHP